jgi:hypothetical protein
MLIPIGFFGGGAPAGSYEWIQTLSGNGSSSTISFTSLPTDYRHLQIRVSARVGSGTAANDLRIRFNSISTTTYSSRSVRGQGTGTNGASAEQYVSVNAITLRDSLADASNSGIHTSNQIIDILEYQQTAKNKTLKVVGGSMYSPTTSYLYSGLLPTTAAITSIDLIAGSSSFSANSNFSLYGIKG